MLAKKHYIKNDIKKSLILINVLTYMYNKDNKIKTAKFI